MELEQTRAREVEPYHPGLSFMTGLSMIGVGYVRTLKRAHNSLHSMYWRFCSLLRVLRSKHPIAWPASKLQLGVVRPACRGMSAHHVSPHLLATASTTKDKAVCPGASACRLSGSRNSECLAFEAFDKPACPGRTRVRVFMQAPVGKCCR